MIYIEKIKIVNKTYPSNVLKIGLEFICSSVNLFVGDQGCGKSTLLQLIQQSHSDVEMKLTDDVIKNGVSSFYFDSENHNPRANDPELYTNPNGTNKGMGYGGALRSRFRSHGEVLEELIIGPVLSAKNCVILLDEPESGLSITNQQRLIVAINKAVDNGCQLFVATHCYPLIEQFDVISLEHRKQMSGLDFIKKARKKAVKF